MDRTLAAYELGGTGDVLLIAHATGLCGAMYQLLADELARRLPSRRPRLPRSRRLDRCARARPPTGIEWPKMSLRSPIGSGGTDSWVRALDGRAALLLAERNVPATFSSLFLFEPIIFPDDFPTDGQNVMGDAARRRRVEFESRAEVLYRYASRPPFNQVHAGFLAGYVDNGFADQPDGRVRLKCLPEVEAQVFENGRDVKLSAVEHLTTPVAVAVGHDEPGSNPARMGPPLAEALARGELIRYDHIGHFGPLQDPWTVARDIRRHIAGL